MATTRPPDDQATHSEVSELLPWYLNDTLSDDERRMVDGHLPQCAECRAYLGQWTRLAKGTASAEPGPLPHPVGFRRLVDRLGAASEESPERSRAGRLLRSGSGPGVWRWIVVAQAAAIVLLAWASLAPASNSPAPAAFRTLASTEAKGPTWELRIVFDERASEHELRAILLPLDATFVDGPSPLGVYTIAIPDRFAVAETVAALRARSAVELAEPASADGRMMP